jgi:hypothetical protein
VIALFSLKQYLLAMRIEKNDLFSKAKKIGISQDKAEALWHELESQKSPQKFDISLILYFFGTILVLVAMSWYMSDALMQLGGQSIFWLAVVYGLCFFALGRFLWNKRDLITPGGLFISLAVCMIPLAVYGLQKWYGLWPKNPPGEFLDINSWAVRNRLLIALATVLGGSIALYFYRFSFLTMPIFFALWSISMDLGSLITNDNLAEYETRNIISILFGIGVLVVAYIMDLKSKLDLSFWPYLFGVLSFWGGLSLLELSEFGNFIYLLINLGLILLSVFLQRTVFLIFGGIGVFIYVTGIFSKYFSNSISFPIVLSIIGILVVFLGILYHKNHQKIEAYILNSVPGSLRKWLPLSQKHIEKE